MVGALKRAIAWCGMDDNSRYDEQYRAYGEPIEDVLVEEAEQQASPAQVTVFPERRIAAVEPVTQVADINLIFNVRPRSYNEARAIGESFRDGIPVIMNLSDMAEGDDKRLVDFAAGLIFGLHGNIERVSSKVFLLCPQNLTVGPEDKERIASGGFFNQS